VIRDLRLAMVYAENSQRHANPSFRYRGAVPWRAYIHGVWGSLIRMCHKRLNREIGEDD
jgi:hypothetical protein